MVEYRVQRFTASELTLHVAQPRLYSERGPLSSCLWKGLLPGSSGQVRYDVTAQWAELNNGQPMMTSSGRAITSVALIADRRDVSRTRKTQHRKWISAETLKKVKARKKQNPGNCRGKQSNQEEYKKTFIDSLAKEAEDAAAKENMKNLYDTINKASKQLKLHHNASAVSTLPVEVVAIKQYLYSCLHYTSRSRRGRSLEEAIRNTSNHFDVVRTTGCQEITPQRKRSKYTSGRGRSNKPIGTLLLALHISKSSRPLTGRSDKKAISEGRWGGGGQKGANIRLRCYHVLAQQVIEILCDGGWLRDGDGDAPRVIKRGHRECVNQEKKNTHRCDAWGQVLWTLQTLRSHTASRWCIPVTLMNIWQQRTNDNSTQ
ncbi:hypothetical protein LSAT2_013489 [Lamellibrachia satsuma]|nr:hypothetical protein LSAT2_013489 [Lamellibrachia satsuma]